MYFHLNLTRLTPLVEGDNTDVLEGRSSKKFGKIEANRSTASLLEGGNENDVLENLVE